MWNNRPFLPNAENVNFKRQWRHNGQSDRRQNWLHDIHGHKPYTFIRSNLQKSKIEQLRHFVTSFWRISSRVTSWRTLVTTKGFRLRTIWHWFHVISSIIDRNYGQKCVFDLVGDLDLDLDLINKKCMFMCADFDAYYYSYMWEHYLTPCPLQGKELLKITCVNVK